MATTFKLGDKVKWASQANGSWFEKFGTVVVVVPPRIRPGSVIPDEVRWTHTTTIDPRSLGRKAESYVVSVTLTPKQRHLTGGHTIGHHAPAKPRLYWPNVPKLQRA